MIVAIVISSHSYALTWAQLPAANNYNYNYPSIENNIDVNVIIEASQRKLNTCASYEDITVCSNGSSSGYGIDTNYDYNQ